MKKYFLLLVLYFVLFPFVIAESKDLFYFDGKINVNTANSEDLQKLPFIGKRKADRIIKYRNKNKKFKIINDLLKIEGIGRDTFVSIKNYITLKGKTSLKVKRYRGKKDSIIHISSYDGPVNVLENRKYFFALTDKIRLSEKSIVVSAYIFKTSKFPTNYANMVLDELVKADGRGVDVQVLLEKNYKDDDFLNIANQNTAKKLRKRGVEVSFDGKGVITHAKIVIIDEKYVFLGSHNLTHTALSKSNETSVMVESDELAKYFTNYINEIKTGK